MKITKPTTSNGWLDRYIKQVDNDDLLLELDYLRDTTVALYSSLTREQLVFRYAPGKWSIAELLVHVMDTERIFSYRALRFARLDDTPLPGFDENILVQNSRADQRPLEALLDEYNASRQASIALYSGFDTAALDAYGIANGTTQSVRAIGFAQCGHERHHLRIIHERYLS